MLTMPVWTIHRSTDREYLYGRFVRLAEDHALRVLPADRTDYVAAWSARYCVGRALTLLGRPYDPGVYSPRFRARAGSDVVFSYGFYPADFDALPVVWEHTFAPQPHADEQAWIRLWRRAQVAERATRIVTATPFSGQWFARIFPSEVGKLRVVPYYFAGLSAIPPGALHAKLDDRDRLRVIFVGKQARRKGLPALTAAWEQMPDELRARIDVHVVSAMLDGRVPLPGTWRYDPFLSDVQSAIERAHVLALPTHSEAFGLVLVEALAAGCVPLTTSAPLQRSIVGSDAGVFVDPRDPATLARALTALARDREDTNARMRAARARFLEVYDPGMVGDAYADLLWEAAGRSGRCPRRAAEP
jgi:glycosyltransferase involved in cell wall biosynthesis